MRPHKIGSTSGGVNEHLRRFNGCRDYLRRIHQYRKRTWTCSKTGTSGLTYEEALICEAKANGEAQEVRNGSWHSKLPQ